MNRNLYRLVFDRQRSMRVPVAEHARAARPGARRSRKAAALLLLVTDLALAANLPVPAATFVTQGSAANPVISGAQMRIVQNSPTTVMNWQSFDIGRGYGVEFQQPSNISRAINLIGGANPSHIFGALKANGQVLLFNQNGILFGSGAQVDVGGLVASALSLKDSLFEKALSSLGASGPTLELGVGAPTDAAVRVMAGARIVTAPNGRVFLAAPQVSNAGTILTPEGQTILAAGQKVYLADPVDSRLRGFIVEVDGGGTASNERLGEIIAERGNITLAGLAVRQEGHLKTTTSVNLNGSIYLQARDTATPLLAKDASGNDVQIPVGTRTGAVTLGGNSLTEVATETADDAKIRDDAVFNSSQVRISGRSIELADAATGDAGARIVAPGGQISLSAQDGQIFSVSGTPVAGARIYLGQGARIDAAGHREVQRAIADDVVEVDLRGEVLADSPLQRDPAYGRTLYGQKVWVDMRKGTSIGNIEGYRLGLERTVAEKNASGGTVELMSEGDVLMHRAASVNVSGGSVAYQTGDVPITLLRYREGGVVEVARAAADRLYAGKLDTTRRENGYLEGRDAGSLKVQGYRVALDGQLLGGTVAGPYQREPNKLPRGGELVIGNASGPFQTPDVFLARLLPQRELSFAGAAPDSLTLSTGFMAQGGFSHFSLTSDGAVTLNRDAVLAAGAGGSVKVKAREITVEGSILAPGGKVALDTVAISGDGSIDPAAHDIQIGGNATISTAGLWVNDIGRIQPTDPALVNGGTISLSSLADLRLAAGSVLDVSGGAWWQGVDKIKPGKAGELTLKSGSFNAGESGPWVSSLVLDGSLRGYGLAYGATVSAGGKLTLATSSVRISGSEATGNAGSLLRLNTGFFNSGGFREFAVTGQDGLTVTAGSTVQPKPQTRILARASSLVPNGSDAAAWSSLTYLPAEWRQGTFLTLAASSVLNGNLTVEKGARLEVDPRGSIALNGKHRIDLAGILRAPGGSIKLAMGGHDQEAYDPTRAIFLADTARIDTDGVAMLKPQSLLREGEVLAGGSIDIDAGRGYLIAQQGSRLSADGASAVLDLAAGVGGARQAVTVDSRGGSIRLSARDGLLTDAGLSARGGGAALGGSLEVGLRMDETWSAAPGEDAINAGRRLILTQDEVAGTVGLVPGAPMDIGVAGIGRLAANRVRDGGFADLRLFVSNRNVAEGNRIEVAENTTLALPRLLTFDTPNLIATNGASANFSAAAFQLSNTLVSAQHGNSLMNVVGGGGTLNLSGRLGEVTGNVAVSGFGTVNLTSVGDLRLNGVVYDTDLSPGAENENFRLRGSLISGGDLNLQAAQVYPSTQTEFAIEIHGKADGRVRILPNGAPGELLSAAGSLSISAPHIEQRGILRAPFGELRLTSEQNTRSDAYTVTRSAAPGGSVILADGSLTSVSGDGLTVPFGTTELGGRDWIYNLGSGRIAYETPPQKSLILKGDRVDVAAGAKLDLSGGGDLTAWEFVAGPGGSKDVLDFANAANTYAILPGRQLDYAPWDTQNWDASGLKAGDRIVLTANAGALAAGSYTLLPARYALLPGAYLVSLRAGTTDMVSGTTVVQRDGTILVAARSGAATADGSLSLASRTQGVLVMNGDQLRLRSEYIESKAGEVYAGLANVQRPGDAGRLQLQAGSHLGLDGELLARRGAGFLGALVDLTADRLQVTADGAVADAGFVGVSVGTLNRLGAESLLLGAVRKTAADGVTLNNAATEFGARELKVDTGATQVLAAPEVIAVASDRLTVAANARIEATGTTGAPATTLKLVGDGALLRVANGAQHEVSRSGVTRAQGTLDIGADARVAGRSVILDATRDNINAGRIVLPASGGALTVAAGRISAGETAGVTQGLVFSNDQLAALGNPSRLSLRSYSTLDLYGNVTLGNASLDSLRIEAAGLVGTANTGKTALLTAKNVSFGNANGTAFSTAAPLGDGQLRVEAESVTFGKGSFAYKGFADTRIQAARETVAEGVGSHAAEGTLSIAAGRMTAAAGSAQKIAATGTLTTTALVMPADLASASAGGALSLEGARIVHGGVIETPVGRVSLKATGAAATDGVELLAGSRIGARGYAKDFAGATVAAPAGSIVLESTSGDVAIRNDAVVDVSGVVGGDAGSLTLLATSGTAVLDGTLKGAAAAAGGVAPRQGKLTVDARTLSSLDAIAQKAADFQGRLDLRQRQGDLALAAGNTLKSHEISLAADAGHITIAGALDARGPKGGTVELYARPGASGGGDVILASGAVVDVRATQVVTSAAGTAGRGGQVLLESSPNAADIAGRVRVQAGSAILAGAAEGSAAAGGKVILRANRQGSGVNIDPVVGVISGAREVIAEGTRVYTATTPNFTTANNDNSTFMANAAAIRSALGFPANGATTYRIRPHVEYRSEGDFTLAADTTLAGFRYGGEAATLTVRARGRLNVNGSLSDGFSTAATTGILNAPGQSWSYRLTAGADTGAAAASAVRSLAQLETANTGDFSLASNKLVRTGSGDIEVSAGRDIRLGNDGSVIYSAGAADPLVSSDQFFAATNISSRRGEFPANGGNVSLAAGRDVVGGGGAQLINDWLYRMGSAVNTDGTLKPISTTVRRVAWWPRFDLFRQGVGAFGGGDVVVDAGRHVTNLGAVAPTNGRLPGLPGALPSLADLKLQGGGDVTVRAGGDIASGVFFSGLGTVRLDAGGGLVSGRNNTQIPGVPVYPVVALGDASAYLNARLNATLEAVFNPTLLDQVSSNSTGSRKSYFVTYGENSGLTLLSAAGDATLLNGVGKTSSGFNLATTTGEARFYPGQVRVAALEGDVRVAAGMTLSPSSKGALSLLAGDSVSVTGTIKMSDADPASLPSVLRPITATSDDNWINNILKVGVSGGRAHDPQLLASRSPEPVRVVAESGDIRHEGSIVAPMLDVPKSVRMKAGGDILDATVQNQHLAVGDVTRLEAGGDILFTTNTTAIPGGGLEAQRYGSGIITGGPGRVELIAGGDIGLGSSSGVVTRGNYDNPYLPEGGASIFLQAGATTTGYGALLSYLRASAQAPLRATGDIDPLLARYDHALLAHMRVMTQNPTLTAEAAAAAFAALTDADKDVFYAAQRPALLDLTFAAIAAAGRQGVRGSSFQSGYDVLAALFPVGAGTGNADLFYSQLRTEQGGGIRMLAPFGGVNVGLNSPGSAKDVARQGMFSIAGADSDIEVAVGKDFTVNQSRVFTLGGADIMIWSSHGNIDAGKGAKTAAATPPAQGRLVGDLFVVDISAAVTGSGIGTLKGRADTPNGDVRLYAPAGFVDAGDAGIRAGGDLEIGGGLRGGDNIQVGGSISGVAVEAPPAAPPAAPPSSTAEAAKAGEQAVGTARQDRDMLASSLLTVEVVGLGDEEDEERKKRN